VRLFWLLIGIAIAVGAVIEKNFMLLLPALYFILGATLNVGCFAASCAVDLTPRKERPMKEMETTKIDSINHGNDLTHHHVD